MELVVGTVPASTYHFGLKLVPNSLCSVSIKILLFSIILMCFGCFQSIQVRINLYQLIQNFNNLNQLLNFLSLTILIFL